MTEAIRKIRFIMLRRVILAFLLVAALLFLCAGHIDYWYGWSYLFFCGILLLNTCFAIKDKHGLLQERASPGPGIKWWDKIFLIFFIFTFLALIATSALDAGRFHWSGAFSLSLHLLGYVFLFLAHQLTIWAMTTNDYFSSVVRIQKERNHNVIQEGPYRFIRHPGYISGILMGFGIAFALGSFYAFIPAICMALLFVLRTYLEDITLQKELTGYIEYSEKVKYRLLPGIW